MTEENTADTSTDRRSYLKLTSAAAGIGALSRLSERTAAAEQVPYTESGSPHELPGRIQAEDFDEGGKGISYHDTNDANRGSAYRDTGVDIGPTSDDGGGYNIGYIKDGEWLEYTVAVPAGTYDLNLRVAVTQSNGGDVRLFLDGTELGTTSVIDTGGWQSWTTRTIPGVDVTDTDPGVLRIAFATNNKFACNLNWIEFIETSSDPSSGANEGFEVNAEGDITEMGRFSTDSPIPFQDGLETRSTITDDDDVTVYDNTKKTVGDGTTMASHRNVNNEVYAKNFHGSDLSAKVRNAVDYLSANTSGQGRIRVTPKEDDTNWQWDQRFLIDQAVDGGVHLDIDNNVLIDFSVDTWAIDAYRNDAKYRKNPLTITGGIWLHDTNADPDGWLRLRDMVFAHISPRIVRVRNSNGNATGIYLKHNDHWVENTYISGCHIRADRGIDSLPGKENTGVSSDHESFHSTHISRVSFHAWEFGLRCQGKWDFCSFNECTIWTRGTETAAVVLDTTWARGMTIMTLKTEEGSTGSDTYTFEFADSYDGYYGPTIFGGNFHTPNESRRSGSPANPWVNRVWSIGGEFKVDPIGTDIDGNTLSSLSYDSQNGALNIPNSISGSELNLGPGSGVIDNVGSDFGVLQHQGSDRLMWNDGVVEIRNAPLKQHVTDVRTISSPAQGWIAYHDGSGKNTEGPAFYNGAGWISQVDSSTIE